MKKWALKVGLLSGIVVPITSVVACTGDGNYKDYFHADLHGSEHLHIEYAMTNPPLSTDTESLKENRDMLLSSIERALTNSDHSSVTTVEFEYIFGALSGTETTTLNGTLKDYWDSHEWLQSSGKGVAEIFLDEISTDTFMQAIGHHGPLGDGYDSHTCGDALHIISVIHDSDNIDDMESLKNDFIYSIYLDVTQGNYDDLTKINMDPRWDRDYWRESFVIADYKENDFDGTTVADLSTHLNSLYENDPHEIGRAVLEMTSTEAFWDDFNNMFK